MHGHPRIEGLRGEYILARIEEPSLTGIWMSVDLYGRADGLGMEPCLMLETMLTKLRAIWISSMLSKGFQLVQGFPSRCICRWMSATFVYNTTTGASHLGQFWMHLGEFLEFR
jgi:hypothetical protein